MAKEYVSTVDGDIDIELLGKVVTTEDVPCGKGVTTSYMWNGAVVRQDYEVNVTQAAYDAGVKAAANL